MDIPSSIDLFIYAVIYVFKYDAFWVPGSMPGDVNYGCKEHLDVNIISASMSSYNQTFIWCQFLFDESPAPP